jgi:protein-histidine pros-kinase
MLETSVQSIERASLTDEGLLKGILQNSQDGIVLIDDQGRILEWNPAQERITGLTRDQVLGEPLPDVVFHCFPPEGRSVHSYIRNKTMIEALLRGELPEWMSQIFEHEIVRADGGRRVIQISYFPLEGGNGPVAGSIARDVTAQREAERAKRRVLQRKDEFVGSVSHSLRNPLHSLCGFLELLQAGKATDPARQQDLLERALGEARHMASLVNELIDVEGFESGGVQLNMEEVDIGAVIDEAVTSLKEMAERRAVKLAYAPSHPPQAVHANPGRLKQVLVNLLDNAIRISASGSPVLVTSHAEQDGLIVQVIDQGPGISAELEPAVFEKGASSGGAAGGTGLGLYLCKRIIEAHGGTIGVHSQLGVGSTFYFSLPAR